MSLYCDLSVNGVTVYTGQVCLNLTPICNYTYLGFQGWLCFYDSQGAGDPGSPGLGTRFILLYTSPTGGQFQVPLQDVYSQQLTVILNNQNCTLSLYQK